MSKDIKLFCDASVNPKSKVGFGAFFILQGDEPLELIKDKISIKKFENTSSTKLEFETLLWALESLNLEDEEVLVFTDCQNILGLLNRRKKLTDNNFYTSTRKLISNHELYKRFYCLMDRFNCKFIKVKGHKKSSLKDDTDKLFNLVDKASRKALRDYLEKIIPLS